MGKGRLNPFRIAALCLLLALTSCVQKKGSGDAPPDPSAPYFEPTHIVQVSITMPPADWDALRQQGRSLADIFGGPCLGGPFPSPFTYFRGAVTIDGETLGDVGVRKKGFLGSLDPVRPSLKLKFDEFTPGREFHGLDRITLNNCKQDPSYIRQTLAYQAFARAGIVAPRCNFARVTVNGTDFGIYAHVESVDREFIRRRYYDDRGTLYSGTLSDFRPQWVDTFEKKTNDANPDRSDLDAVVTALAAPDAAVVDALDAVIDVEQFITFWATEVLIGHWDGYAGNTNNFFAYHDPVSGRFQFIPWGADGVMEPNAMPGASGPTSVFARAALARRLYLLPSTQARYLDKLRALLDSAWNETAILDEIARMQALITPVADPTGAAALAAQIDQVRAFVSGRRAAILGELAAGPPPWTEPLRDPPCFNIVGPVSGTFTTTWGTLGALDPFAAGSGTIVATVSGTTLSHLAIGATAGPGLAPPGATANIVGVRSDGSVDLIVLVVDTALYAPGAAIPLDWGSGFGALWNSNPSTGAATLVGYIFNGVVQFNEAGTAAGAPVSGSFQGEVTTFGF